MKIVAATKSDPSMPQLAKMITHRFNGIEQVANALQTAGLGIDAEGLPVVKVVVNNDS